MKVKLDLCLHDLELVKAMETPYCKQLQDDLKDGMFRVQHKVTNTNFNLQNLTAAFIDALTTNIKSRFPDADFLTAFSVLGMRPLSFLTDKDLEEYGVEGVSKLSDFCGASQVVQWVDENNVQQHENTSDPVIDTEATQKECKLLKHVVKAEMYQETVCPSYGV